MRLYQVKHSTTVRARQQTFCGPGALSSILNITAEEAGAQINALRNHSLESKIRSSYSREVISILSTHGVLATEINVQLKTGMRKVRRDHWPDFEGQMTLVNQNETLNQWYESRNAELRDTLCLIVCGTHFVVVKGNMVADNQRGKISFAKSTSKKKRINRIWRLSKSPTTITLSRLPKVGWAKL